jgi:prefoldin subunit 5
MRKEHEVNIEETISFYDEELRDIELKRHELSNTEQSKLDIVQQIDNKLQEIKQEISLLTK